MCCIFVDVYKIIKWYNFIFIGTFYKNILKLLPPLTDVSFEDVSDPVVNKRTITN